MRMEAPAIISFTKMSIRSWCLAVATFSTLATPCSMTSQRLPYLVPVEGLASCFHHGPGRQTEPPYAIHLSRYFKSMSEIQEHGSLTQTTFVPPVLDDHVDDL